MIVCGMLGAPVMLDAAQAGSHALRCRNYWQNSVNPAELLALVSGLEWPPGLLVSDIMEPSRYVSEVSRTDQQPFFTAKVKGELRSCFPTLVAYSMSRAFRDEGAGCVYDTNPGIQSEKRWTEPNPGERELALGYRIGITAAPGVTLAERHTITGNCMDQRALRALVGGAKT